MHSSMTDFGAMLMAHTTHSLVLKISQNSGWATGGTCLCIVIVMFVPKVVRTAIHYWMLPVWTTANGQLMLSSFGVGYFEK